MTNMVRINKWSTVRVRGDGRISIGDGARAISVADTPENLRLIELLCTGGSVESICATFSAEYSRPDTAGVRQAVHELIEAGAATYNEALESAYNPESRSSDIYDRQFLYWQASGLDRREAGQAQSLLSSAKVLILGCGGMGSMTALNLAVSGVGNFHIVDNDDVDASNLNRSFIFDESSIGLPKVDTVANGIRRLRPEVCITTTQQSIQSRNDIETIINTVNPDYMVMSADKPYLKINLWANEAALNTRTPYSTAGVSEGFASIGPMTIPGETGCFACQGYDMYDILDAPPAIRSHNLHRVAPSFGPAISATGAMHADQIIKYVANTGTPAIINKQIQINFEDLTLRSIDRSARGECSVCSSER